VLIQSQQQLEKRSEELNKGEIHMLQSIFEHAAIAFLVLVALAIYISKNTNQDEKKKLMQSLRKAPSNFYNNLRTIFLKITAKGENK